MEGYLLFASWQMIIQVSQMNFPNSTAVQTVSDNDRDLLRKSVRDFLADVSPVDKAVENASNVEALAKLWPAMARQGLSTLGSIESEVGLREILVVFEELGRASCPAPLLGAVAANLTLATLPSNAARALLEDIHQGEAMIALALGTFDGDPAAGRAEMRGDTLWGKTVVCRRRADGNALRHFHRQARRRRGGGKATRPD